MKYNILNIFNKILVLLHLKKPRQLNHYETVDINELTSRNKALRQLYEQAKQNSYGVKEQPKCSVCGKTIDGNNDDSYIYDPSTHKYYCQECWDKE